MTRLLRIYEKPFCREDTIANNFASEWSPIIGRPHNTVPTKNLRQALIGFITMPPDRVLSRTDNARLMMPITLTLVITAITVLDRHKAAGPDGLNNDFLKDFQALLGPALVTIGNELLQNRAPPKSFLEGLIIPLQKKGDSIDAMDYRTIALLQTG